MPGQLADALVRDYLDAADGFKARAYLLNMSLGSRNSGSERPQWSGNSDNVMAVDRAKIGSVRNKEREVADPIAVSA